MSSESENSQTAGQPRAKADKSTPQAYTSALLQDGDRWLLTARDDTLPSLPSPGLVPAVENAIAIINFINRTPPHLASLTELTIALQISKSHCHAILKTLTHFGWFRFDKRTKTYELNSGILASVSSLVGSPVLDGIRDELVQFVRRTGISVVLSQPQMDDSFIAVDKFNGAQAMEVSFPIGHHYPRDSPTNMRAYLAWQPQSEIDRWMQSWRPIRYTNATLMTAQEVRAEIAATRRRGYARSVGELTEGLMAMGMPIFNRNGEVIFVFTCSALLPTLAAREEIIAHEIIYTAVQINRSILGSPPADFPTL